MATDDKRARWSDATFLIGFGATLFVLAWICLEFLMPLVLAASAAILVGGWHERLARGLGGRRWLSALLMTVATFIVVLGPLVYIIVRLVQELAPFLETLADSFGSGRLSAAIQRAIPDRLAELVDINEVEAQLRRNIGTLGAGAAAFATSIPARAANVLVDGFIAFVALYVYFVRGPQIARAVVEATPMEKRHTERLIETIAAAVRTVFVASFITAVIQFGLGWLAFRIVHVPYAMALAGIMAFFSFIFSLVPVLGSGLVWVPVGVGLVIGGRPIAGLFILAWGVLVLGSVDNIVKPLYAKGQLQLSPLLVLITVLGGVAVFGPVGAVLGPLVAALAAAFLRIWTTDFLVDAEPLPRVVTRKREPRRPWFLRRMKRHA